MRRAQRLFADPPHWRQVMRRAMAQNFSWTEAAGKYLDMYRQVIGRDRR
jgi:starch synthase